MMPQVIDLVVADLCAARGLPLAFGGSVVADEDGLFAEELTSIEGFNLRRRAEFAAGRRAAREALTKLGAAPSAILATPRGVPIFPRAYIGSISHKDGYALAVASTAAYGISLGIDLEIDFESDEKVLAEQVCTEREAEAAATLLEAGIASPATWFLSAKEAVFKAVFPLDGIERDYKDIELAFAANSFSVASLASSAHASRVVGMFVRAGADLVSLAIMRR